MKITQVSAGTSFKCKTRPHLDKNFDMSEFSSFRTAEIEPGENPDHVAACISMMCRADVVDAFKKAGLAYAGGQGTAGQDRSYSEEGYVQIGEERPRILRMETVLSKEREDNLIRTGAPEAPVITEETPDDSGFPEAT